MDMKRCSKCGDTKLVTEFGFGSKSKDGEVRLRAQCRECRNAAAKAWQGKRRAEKALQYRNVQDIHEPRRKCPRCKESKPWNEYPEMTRKNQGINFMCNECRGRAEKARKAKANKKWAKMRAMVTKKRLSTAYQAKMKADAQSWRAYMKSMGRIWYGTIREDAKQWREHIKKEVQVQAQAKPNPYTEKGIVRTSRLQAEIDSWPKSDKLLPLK